MKVSAENVMPVGNKEAFVFEEMKTVFFREKMTFYSFWKAVST